MRPTPILIRSVLATFLLLLVAAPAFAQDAGDEVFGERIEVRLINLEVVVSQRGERVSGLAKDDFTLLVDGAEMPIEYFSEVRDGRAAGSAPVAPGRASAAVSALPGGPVGTDYLVFIDDYFAVPAQRNRLIDRIIDQLDRLGDEDRVAVVCFDGERLELLAPWTRSRGRLAAALEAARERRAYGLHWRSGRLTPPRSFATRGDSFSGIGFHGRSGRYTERDLRSELAPGVASVVRAGAAAMRGVGLADGRRVMLLLTGGLPLEPSLLADAATGITRFTELQRVRDLFEPLVSTANRLGYTIYPVDVQGGLRRLRSTAGDATLGASFFGSRLGRERERLDEDVLEYLAERTGGKALVGHASNDALAAVIADTRTYYWLGFSPAWREDDVEHEVQVRLRPKRMRSRARRSFSDLSRSREMSMWIEGALLFDRELPGAELDVALGTPDARGRGRVELPIRLEIPYDRFTSVPAAGGYRAELELRVAGADVERVGGEIPVVPVEISRETAPRPGEVAVYETSLDLRAKPHRLLFSVFDPSSGNVLSRRLDFVP